MASWRPPGSILEAPGLDFGGSEAQLFQDFRMILALCAENLPRTCRDLSRFCQAIERLPSIAKLLCPLSIGPRSSEVGWGGGGPPRGVCN